MRPFLQYAATCLAIVAVVGAVAWALVSPAGRQAVFASAALALGVQAIAFVVARLLRPRNLLLGWGLGSLLRLVALVLYALVVAKLWRAPLAPALLTFVAFLFVTTVIEPVFLRR
ncbi:MAG: hypothetical protein WD825_00590 [Gemmatimonadaceae bacterium]